MALVTLRSYRDPIDAELAKLRLEDAGIPAVILDQHLASIQWLYSQAIGGVKLKVDDADLDEAERLLREDLTADLSGIAESRAPMADGEVCPVCGSSEVRPSQLQRYAAAISLATGLPLIAWRRRWICAACRHSWARAPSSRSEIPEETQRAEKRVHEKRSYPILAVFLLTLLGLAVLYYVQIQIRRPS